MPPTWMICTVIVILFLIMIWPSCHWGQEHTWVYWRKPWPIRRCTSCGKVQIRTRNWGWVQIEELKDEQ